MGGLTQMQSIFPNYYSLTPSELKKLWNGCFFVLDSNILLNLYRFPAGARKDLLGVLTHFKDRLWLPHQVALEYQRNRASVVAEQIGRFGSVVAAIGRGESALRSEVEKLQLKKRHSTIDPDTLLSKVFSELASAKELLEQQRLKQQEHSQADPIRPEIENLFEGRIGPPFSDEELVALYKEGAVRYQHYRPPGYMDHPKSKERDAIYYYNGLPMHSQYGDLLIWRQILREAKTRRAEDLIFVTDDEKEDWWLESSGRTIGPRPELIEEARIDAGVVRFNVYISERFIEYAQKQLGLTIQPGSIREIRETKDGNDDTFVNMRMRAVHAWLATTEYSADDIVSMGGDPTDFVIRRKARKVAVLAVPKATDLAIKNAIRRVHTAAELNLWSAIVVLIASRSHVRLVELQKSALIRTLRQTSTVRLLHLEKRATGGYVADQVG